MPTKKDSINEAIANGEPLTESVTKTLQTMRKVGDMRIVHVSRRTDIQSAVNKYNAFHKTSVKITQSRVYLFHPDSGQTIQTCYLITRVE